MGKETEPLERELEREGAGNLTEGLVLNQCGSPVCVCKDSTHVRKKNIHAKMTDGGREQKNGNKTVRMTSQVLLNP